MFTTCYSVIYIIHQNLQRACKKVLFNREEWTTKLFCPPPMKSSSYRKSYSNCFAWFILIIQQIFSMLSWKLWNQQTLQNTHFFCSLWTSKKKLLRISFNPTSTLPISKLPYRSKYIYVIGTLKFSCWEVLIYVI